jgi:hypothetical protein
VQKDSDKSSKEHQLRIKTFWVIGLAIFMFAIVLSMWFWQPSKQIVFCPD